VVCSEGGRRASWRGWLGKLEIEVRFSGGLCVQDRGARAMGDVII
jgi:hypothetical protein